MDAPPIVAAGLWEAALPAVITALLGLVTGFLVQRMKDRGEIQRLTATIDAERDERFGEAQTGYRALYRKLAKHYDDGDLEALRDDFREAEMVGFEPLNAALTQFWPDERLRALEPPGDTEWSKVRTAFQTLSAMTIGERDAQARASA